MTQVMSLNTLLTGSNVMSIRLYQQLKSVADTKGSNAKLDIMKNLSFEDSEYMRDYLSRVYSGANWYQTKLPKPAGRIAVMGRAPLTILEAIDEFMAGERRGDKGAQRLAVISALLQSDEERELLKWAIWGDIKAGVGPKTINKVWPGLIFIPPYQRCATLDKGYHHKWDWSKGVFVQNKEDQMFGNLITEEGLFTRNFNLIESESVRELNEWATNVKREFGSLVFHGEIQVKDASGEYVTREKSNGMINGLIQTGEELPTGYTVNMTLWNVVDKLDFYRGVSPYPYQTCFETVREILQALPCDRLRLVKNDRVKSMEDVKVIFREVLKAKGEGLVMKDPDGVWEDDDGGSQGQVKVKIEMPVELRVIGFNEADAKSKYRDQFASLQCVSEDGKVVTGVAGMSDAWREKINADREFYLGSVIAVQCNGIQWNEQEPHSLYYPQFQEPRPDKHTADTLEEIISIQDSAVDACVMSKAQ